MICPTETFFNTNICLDTYIHHKYVLSFVNNTSLSVTFKIGDALLITYISFFLPAAAAGPAYVK